MDYINPNLCTHMIYTSTAIVDAEEMTIQVRDLMTDVVGKSFDKFVALKEKNPNLKVMIAMGATTYGHNLAIWKLLANNTEFTGNIDKFVVSTVAFLQRFQFDGLHLEWQYSYQVPHQEGFSYLAAALRKAFRKHGYLLSATVTPLTWFVPKEFDVPSLNENLDFVDIMAFRFHGEWEKKVDHHAQLSDNSGRTRNADFAVTKWIEKGFSPNKLILGIPLFGHSWTLASNVTTPGAPGNGGIGSGTPTTTYYNDICGWVRNENWTVVRDPTKSMGPYVLSQTTPQIWVGYDDPAMAVVKTKYAMDKGLGGVSVYSVDMDDFQNKCGDGENPVMTAIAKTLGIDIIKHFDGYCSCICTND